MINITPLELKKMIDQDSCTVVDVRNLEEYSDGIINGAALIPMNTIYDKDVSEISDGGKPLVFVCAGGVRSAKVCKFFEDNYSKTNEYYNLSGGMRGWKENGMPTVKFKE